MKWISWKAFVPPAALPLAVSIAVALAGPGGILESPSQQSNHEEIVGNPRPPENGGSTAVIPSPTAIPGPDGSLPVPTRTSAPGPNVTPLPTPPVKPSPLPSPPPSVPTPAPPPGSTPTPPPGSTLTPPPTATPTLPPGSTPTPPPGPILIEAEVVVMVKDYTITNMATVTVLFNWCTADWLGTAWGAICQIVDPACRVFTDLGLLCPLPPLALNFYLYESGPVITPADAATTLVLNSY